MSKFKMIKKTD
jgi:hypothetical protein